MLWTKIDKTQKCKLKKKVQVQFYKSILGEMYVHKLENICKIYKNMSVREILGYLGEIFVAKAVKWKIQTAWKLQISVKLHTFKDI